MPRNQLLIPITTRDKSITAVNAFLWGIGTSSIIVQGLWFASELGLTLSGLAAVATLATISVATLILALPIAYSFYKEMLAESESNNEKIISAINHQTKQQYYLVFYLLRLRSYYNNSELFSYYINGIFESTYVHTAKIINFVNKLYDEFKHTNYIINEHNRETQIRESRGLDNSVSFQLLLQNVSYSSNPFIKKYFIEKLIQQPNVDETMSHCFKKNTITKSPETISAIGHGIITALTITGITLGTGWSFAALGVGMGLCAAIPVAGWILLGVFSIVSGIMFGLAMGIQKHKNTQRELLLTSVKENNVLLRSSIQTIKQAVYRHSMNINSLLIKPEIGQAHTKNYSKSLKKTMSVPALSIFHTVNSPSSCASKKEKAEKRSRLVHL